MSFYEEQARKYLDFSERDLRGLTYWCNTKGFRRYDQEKIRQEVNRLKKEREGTK